MYSDAATRPSLCGKRAPCRQSFHSSTLLTRAGECRCHSTRDNLEHGFMIPPRLLLESHSNERNAGGPSARACGLFSETLAKPPRFLSRARNSRSTVYNGNGDCDSPPPPRRSHAIDKSRSRKIEEARDVGLRRREGPFLPDDSLPAAILFFRICSP